jgi:hypothetical protein
MRNHRITRRRTRSVNRIMLDVDNSASGLTAVANDGL